jgi:hypothetical protein
MEPVQINKIRNLKGNVELNLTKEFIDFNILSKNHFAALQPDIKRYIILLYNSECINSLKVQRLVFKIVLHF